jgi:hypothetical protein
LQLRNLLLTKLGGTASNGTCMILLLVSKIIRNKKLGGAAPNVLGGMSTSTKTLIKMGDAATTLRIIDNRVMTLNGVKEKK